MGKRIELAISMVHPQTPSKLRGSDRCRRLMLRARKLQMRLPLKLTHSLMALLIGQVVAATVALSALLLWNLDRGWQEYLTARTQDRLFDFAQEAGIAMQAAGTTSDGTPIVRVGPILDALAAREGRVRNLAPRLPPCSDQALDKAVGECRPQGALRDPPPPTGDPFEDGVGIQKLSGERLAGHPQRRAGPLLREPIRLNGQTVAWAVISRPSPDWSLDGRFIRSQAPLALAGVLALIVLAGGLAFWVSSLWARPLLDISRIADRISRGEFDVRVAPDRGPVEVVELAANINNMAEKLGTLEGSRRRLLAEVSHDLRTPVSILQGELEMLLAGVRPTSTDALTSLHEEILALSALIDDLHLLALSDISRLALNTARVDPVEVCERAVARFYHRAADAGLSLTINTTDPGRRDADWDVKRMERLLANLLENSIRYTREPGRIELSLSGDHGGHTVVVQDSAPGLAPDVEASDQWAARGSAVDVSLRRPSGLGLAVVKAIAASHGGTVVADASNWGGARVTVTLPGVMDT